MKEQKFKFDHHTAIYHGGGKYTLIADEGYLMQSGTTQAKQVETNDYTQWTAIESSEDVAEKEAEKNRKALATLGTIFEMAHDQNKIGDCDERMEAVDKALSEQFPDCDMETTVPPIEAMLKILRDNGLGAFADAFDKAWADEDFTPIIDAMPELPADDVTDEGEGEGEGEGEKPANDTEAPAENEKPADQQPAEEQPKTKKSKAEKAE